ncbi:unnamed protein product [Blepharisma stoltei]|uniref:Uncharacterized protein n=1 Tax=Blepharisma stoltei TaxID=1481888 RepID=A0AAU9J4D8_9CILI|nr:unnamed protein product [Blepharisma stoltei]
MGDIQETIDIYSEESSDEEATETKENYSSSEYSSEKWENDVESQNELIDENSEAENEAINNPACEEKTESLQIAITEKNENSKIDEEELLESWIETSQSTTERNEKINDKYQSQPPEKENKDLSLEEKIKEFEDEIFHLKAEKSQEIALLEQKISFLEASLEEGLIREKKISNEVKTQKQMYTQAVKDINAKHENYIADLQAQVLQETEKFNELERIIFEKDTEIEKFKILLNRNEEQLSNIIKETKEETQLLKTKFDKKEIFYKQELKNLQQSAELEIQHLREKLHETEGNLREKDTFALNSQSQSQKEIAILQQKIEFLEQDLLETKNNLEDERKSHESMLYTIGQVSLSPKEEDLLFEIEKLKSSHTDQIKETESKYEDLIKNLNENIKGLKQGKELAETQYNSLLNEATIKQNELLNIIENVKQEKIQLQEKNKNYAENSANEDNEARLKKRIKDLELRIEELNANHGKEVDSLKRDNDQVLNQIKQLMTNEKQAIEQRTKYEKERYDKKYALACEEYENRLREEQERYEEEINSLHEELREMQEASAQETQQHNNKIALYSQKIENLENYLQNTKEQLSLIQNSHTQASESQLQSFNNERVLLSEKIEKLSNEAAFKDREIANFIFKTEQNESKIKNLDRELDELKEQFNKERVSYIERIESAKKANHKLADEVNKKKSDYKREIALANQHIEFQAKKIADLEKSLQENSVKYNDSIKSWKTENGQELSEMVEKLSLEKEYAEKKLEEKRKATKELEMKHIRQVNILEKEKALLEENLAHVNNKKDEIENRLSSEIKDLQEQLALRGGIVFKDKSSVLNDCDALRARSTELEHKVNELQILAERDKILWENKFNFLLSQRDQARNDLADHQKKFDIALEQLQKREMHEKDKIETATASLIASVESRYSNQIKEIQETNLATINELNNKISLLDRELQAAKDELGSKKNNYYQNENYEKKINELIENEQKLKSEFEVFIKQKDKKIKELADFIKNEKENFKNKFVELEQKVKESDHQKSQIFLEHEKEKAKWALERDIFLQQKNESQDLIERLEKRKESLIREIEKYRSERPTKPRPSSNIRAKPPITLNRSFIPSFMENSSYEEFSKEKYDDKGTEYSTPSSSATHESSPLPLRLKNCNASRPLSSMSRNSNDGKRKRDENIRY